MIKPIKLPSGATIYFVEWPTFLKPFSEIKECPKCGGHISLKYYDGKKQVMEAELYGGLKGTGLNYLIKTCDDCGYSWREKTKEI